MRDVTDRGPLFAQAIKSKVEAIAYRARTRARSRLRESGGHHRGFSARRLPGRADMSRNDSQRQSDRCPGLVPAWTALGAGGRIDIQQWLGAPRIARSEERRVGKECRSRW